GKPDPNRPYWLGQDKLVAEADVNAVLQLVDPKAQIVRVAGLSEISANGALAGTPTINKPQVIQSKLLRPMLLSLEGMLIGDRRIGNRRIVVLSDPDILSNFALTRGDNSVLA